MLEPKTIALKNGVKLHFINTNKFKTTVIKFYIHQPLEKETVTINALLTLLFKRACPKYDTSIKLSNKLSDLFGASLDVSINKTQDEQIISVSFSFVNEKFLPEKENVSKEILEMAKSIIFEQNVFNEDYVSQEKENLKNLILSEKNDKRLYAQSRLIEEMCKGEKFGIKKIGYIDDIAKITPENLLKHYKEVINSAIYDVFVFGDVNESAFTDLISNVFENINVDDKDYLYTFNPKNVDEVKTITETEKITQGKLSIGFRTDVNLSDKRYPAMMVFNAIFGNGPYSKLFNNVREKLSLCYYASSSINYLNGIMFINSGIEVKNYNKAYDEIFVQLDDVKNGKISNEELTAAKLGIINSLKSMEDSPYATMDYYINNYICKNNFVIDDLMKKVKEVSIDDVMNVAKTVKLDTVFFLKGSDK